jgi:hypothetical protein
MVIISDEIYRDLVYDDEPEFETPCSFTSERTVVTSGLSKSLALGGWRLGVARLPDGQLGHELRGRLLAIGSEIWSAPANPIQHAAAYAYGEPAVLTDYIGQSRRLHAAVARAVADRFAAAGANVQRPQAAFYVYPDFGPLADLLMARYEVTSDEGLADLLLRRYGVGVLPASAFGEQAGRLRLRVATAMIYGETEEQRRMALAADDPCALPWIAAALGRLEEVLTDLVGLGTASSAIQRTGSSSGRFGAITSPVDVLRRRRFTHGSMYSLAHRASARRAVSHGCLMAAGSGARQSLAGCTPSTSQARSATRRCESALRCSRSSLHARGSHRTRIAHRSTRSQPRSSAIARRCML